METHSIGYQTTDWSRAAQSQHMSDGARDDFRYNEGEQRRPWSESGIVSIAEYDVSMSAMGRHYAYTPSRCSETKDSSWRASVPGMRRSTTVLVDLTSADSHSQRFATTVRVTGNGKILRRYVRSQVA